ncbi:unnamed protein product [Echinostoma caproni]|uniref:Reverse transcriptase domain-containing protein n=1 Tax=Echinostoma caproni TaxID=27848 RepID=A0A183BCT5_9TREM|nr:unnamed protein product [Echinostoma caproni]
MFNNFSKSSRQKFQLGANSPQVSHSGLLKNLSSPIETPRVCVARSLFAWYRDSSVVPQDSGLGPLLFIGYLNDLHGELRSPSLMYADDIKIFRTIEGMQYRSTLQADLSNLAQ